MNFPKEELIDMVYVLGASDKNCLLARRIYRERFPARRQPSKQAFENLMNRFDRTGVVNYEKTERTKTATSEENAFNVVLRVTEDPHVSSKDISRQFEISQTSVRRILSTNKMHPYHIQLHQELLDTDFENRLAFCTWSQRKIQEERNIFDLVLFADEATFHKNGCVNRHNFHYYSTDNPHIVRTSSQTRWSLNVWGGIIGNYVVGPHFFEGRVNGQIYLEFLQNILPLLLEHIPHNVKERMWYLHDGAPVHHTAAVHNHLDTNYPGRWIGRGGPFRWPPRSPDLTKIDFFLWGFVKNEVYKFPTTTKEDMKNRIRNVFQNVTIATLRNVSDAFERRLQRCIDVGGGHFEQLL